MPVVLTNYGMRDKAIRLDMPDMGDKTTTVIQTDTTTESWYETLTVDPFTYLNLPAMSVTTVLIN